MIPKIYLKKNEYKVYKTGLPFYDAARLIGVAHLFFGTASAEIVDKGAYWEVKGIDIKRDKEQIEWIIERLERTLSNEERKLFERRKFWWEMDIYFSKIVKEIERGKVFSIQKCDGKYKIKIMKNNKVIWEGEVKKDNEVEKINCSNNIKTKMRRYLKVMEGNIKKLPLKAEYDASLQIGTRGADPLADYKRLAPRSTEVKEKKFLVSSQEITVATLGRAFAARITATTKRQQEEMYILPIFSSHVVLSGFLDYERNYQHSAGGFVASVLAAISILLDLTSKKIPVSDFAYTKEVKGPPPQRFPVSSESGYLGFEKLCSQWWKAVEENNEVRLKVLARIKNFLKSTSDQNTDNQNQELARHLANFVVNLDVNSLCMIEKLKARILARKDSDKKASSESEKLKARNLFNKLQDIEEVRKMMELELPGVPENVSKALAKAMELDEKAWMNYFTRLENATDFSQFISYIEHIISRGFYRELQKEKREKEKRADIRLAMNRARELASTLKELHKILADEKKFRAWKAIFLLDVLSKMEFKIEGGE